MEQSRNSNSQRLAPFMLRQEIEIAAPLDVVWDLLVHVNEWPSWQPGIEAATLDGSLSVGAQFRWSCGCLTTTAIVDAVAQHRLLLWRASDEGATGVHEWTFEPVRHGTRVIATEFLEEAGWRDDLEPSHRTADEFLCLWLEQLKAEAEART
ncbi:polyketide cyclase/dehydrase/lipid transport protein [Glaciihabitans tibetensis]|uniref:Polyketide cyclase/dehydrase/lipid transport protein n=1 Tax=Glaciihabitans tibetensis TaxID=1266600 RepID=A0A2T0VAI8_9MICO|nr:SRPBCC family protein [Glaciihabitans tibetensis]PRY67057.1 polyketide cyclase/dehydrase/lipid transport protein [Glaciihabitans tibetensis]